VSNGAQNAAHGVAEAAQKAKVPLMAGGAALAGAAGAAVIAASRSGRKRKVLGIPMPQRNGMKKDARKLAQTMSDAAGRADRFGQRVSRIASGVQKMSETADETAKKT
jgi:hypothetical protein